MSDVGWAAPAPTAVRSVYVHAPFCARRCFYCDFAVQVRKEGGHSEWIQALAGERAALEREGRFPLAERLDTLYVGGGTPSLLGPEAMAALAGVFGRSRLQSPGLDWTAEANPESFTDEIARSWRAAGVNRISLGVQSFHPEALRWMGRLHGADGPARAVAAARRAGLDELSLDLIFALPAHLERSWERDLEQLLALEPPHVSLYGLTVESGTPLGRAVAEGREQGCDEERYRDEYLLAVERLGAAGYLAYEVSNFALPGHESRHNRVYWTGGDYLGMGNGAHSYRRPLRRWNLRDWDVYARAARAEALPVGDEEVVTPLQDRLERIWLGLRTSDGVPRTRLTPAAAARADAWALRGLAFPDQDVVRLTPEGWLLLDRLAVELDDAMDGATADVMARPP